MDILSHGLWAGAAYKAANRTIRKDKKPFRVRLAVFWGIAPDIVSFGIFFAWAAFQLVSGGLNFSDFPVDLERSDMEPAPGDTLFIFRLTSLLYSASHSVFVFALFFGLAALIFRRPIWEMGGWLIHILIDIPTHSYQFYPTPFLWPVSGWKFDGFSWGNPWFVFFNYLAIAAVYFLIIRKENRRKFLLAVLGTVLAAGLIWAAIFYWKNLRGIWPAIGRPSRDITELIGAETPTVSPPVQPADAPALPPAPGPLKLPEGFSISILAKDLAGVRVMAMDALGNMWVSQTSEGKIVNLEIRNGVVVHKNEVLRNLRRPHGLAFDPDDPFILYFAEEHQISKIRIYSEGMPEKIADLPSGGGHFTRTLGFGPDGRLYVSIGSSCNVCYEGDGRRAKIFSMRSDGGDLREFAQGLRNAVFFIWHPLTGKMWATEMGRDLLGDDLPPDEINIVEEGNNYGWPICYGKNIHDRDFDRNTYTRNPCMEPFRIPSYIDIPAHSAPLGLAFFPEEGWPEEYWHDLLVAYHGSWNRSVPTGYKIVRYKLDENGNPPAGGPGEEDFISGWLTEAGGVLGRPVDILIRPDGVIYISDDKSGVIYKIVYQKWN